METFLLTLHIIGAGIFVGIVVFSLLLTFWKPFNKERLRVVLLIRSVGIYAAILMLVSGILLYFQDSEEFSRSPLFWIKIGLFMLDGFIAIFYIDRKIQNNLATQNNKPIPARPWTLLVLINLIIIFAIVTLGVIIAG